VHLLERERIKALGFSQETIDAVNSLLKVMLLNVKENKVLIKHLSTMKKNGLSYSYSHSYLCALIIFKILPKFDWGTDKALEKFIYVCFFHDISLSDDFEMNIRSQSELQLFLNDKKIFDKVNHHAFQAFALLSKFEKIPLDVPIIIKEHHGSKTGIGFTEEISMNLNAMSMVFIVVEDFVSRLSNFQGDIDQSYLVEVLNSMGEKFTKSAYKQTLEYIKQELIYI
jgi:hypothetical protein